jgi:hypothetical protein
MLTSAECQAQAAQKLAEAECNPQHRTSLCNVAEAWLALAKQMKLGEMASRREIFFMKKHGMSQH